MLEDTNILVHSSGKLLLKGKEFRCTVGRGGVLVDKREGDGGTPVGCFPIREVLYRPDKMTKPETVFPVRELALDDGWCEDSKDPNYNRQVKLPHPATTESLWRDDDLYDVIVVLGYNDNPPVPGKGSAIFMHVARPTYSPTAGCVALSLPDLLTILKESERDTLVCVRE